MGIKCDFCGSYLEIEFGTQMAECGNCGHWLAVNTNRVGLLRTYDLGYWKNGKWIGTEEEAEDETK
jgi:hypothetical protein